MSWRVAGIFFALGVLTRVPFQTEFLWAHDSVLYARAIERFDPLDQRPQAPGYLYYVLLILAVFAIVGDPNRAMTVDSGFIHVTSDGGASWHQAYVNKATENPAGTTTPKHKAYRGIGLEDTSALWLTWSNASTRTFAAHASSSGGNGAGAIVAAGRMTVPLPDTSVTSTL